MRRPAMVRQSGPYKVDSVADGTMIVTPSWPQCPAWRKGEGGGPGLFSRLGLAADLERWLNAGLKVEGKERS